MCSRMALSLRAFDRPNEEEVSDIPMTEVGEDSEWRVPSILVRNGSHVALEDGITQTNGSSTKLSANRLEARPVRFTGLKSNGTEDD